MTLPIFLEHPYILLLIAAVELPLKGITLWKAARKGEKFWFLALLIVNSIGILPIIYLLTEKFRSHPQSA